jgi:putative transcriptional regulator
LQRELRVARARADLSKAELADKAGVRRETVSRIERGLHQPQAATREKLARALGVSVEELMPKPLTISDPEFRKWLSEQGAAWAYLTEGAFAGKVRRGDRGDNDSEYERVETELLPEVEAEKAQILGALSKQWPRNADYRRLRRELSSYYNKLIVALMNYAGRLSGGEVPAQRANEYEFA